MHSANESKTRSYFLCRLKWTPPCNKCFNMIIVIFDLTCELICVSSAFPPYLQQRPLILVLSGNCRNCGRPRLLPADTEHDHLRATKTEVQTLF